MSCTHFFERFFGYIRISLQFYRTCFSPHRFGYRRGRL